MAVIIVIAKKDMKGVFWLVLAFVAQKNHVPALIKNASPMVVINGYHYYFRLKVFVNLELGISP